MTYGSDVMGQGDGTLRTAAARVAAAKEDFDRLSSRLDGQIQQLQGTWAGAGGRAFFTLHRAWIERQRVVVRALDDFETSLRATEKDNVGTDEAQSGVFTRTISRLGG